MGMTGNDSGVRKLILIGVIALILMALYAAKSESAEPELSLGFGPALVGSADCGSMGMVLDRSINGRFMAMLVSHGDGTCPERAWHRQRANIGACGLLTSYVKPWTLGFGGCLWEQGTLAFGENAGYDPGVQLSAAILVRRHFVTWPHWYVGIMHGSIGNGAPDKQNPGLNIVGIGYSVLR